jgi:hypothetical protein
VTHGEELDRPEETGKEPEKAGKPAKRTARKKAEA